MWADQLTRHKMGNTIQRRKWMVLWATGEKNRGKPKKKAMGL